MDELKPLCFDCLSEDVTVKVIDQAGFEHWFCAKDWAGWQEFGERLKAMLSDATTQLSGGDPLALRWRGRAVPRR